MKTERLIGILSILLQRERVTAPELAARFEVSRRTIQEVENRDDCRVSTAIKLADALGVSLDELCRDAKKCPPS